MIIILSGLISSPGGFIFIWLSVSSLGFDGIPYFFGYLRMLSHFNTPRRISHIHSTFPSCTSITLQLYRLRPVIVAINCT